MKRRFPKVKQRQHAQVESGFSRDKRRLGPAPTAQQYRSELRGMRLCVLVHNLLILADAT